MGNHGNSTEKANNAQPPRRKWIRKLYAQGRSRCIAIPNEWARKHVGPGQDFVHLTDNGDGTITFYAFNPSARLALDHAPNRPDP